MNEKFDYAISNPPYQTAGNNQSRNHQPIYPEFIDTARLVSREVIMIHPARFLSNAGQTQKTWNHKILQDREFVVVEYYENSETIFPNASVVGGVAITSFKEGRTEGGYSDGFISLPELKQINDKVKMISKDYLHEHIKPGVPFYYTERATQSKDKAVRTNWLVKHPDLFSDIPRDNSLKIIGVNNLKRVIKYIDRDLIQKSDLTDKYKVLIPYSSKFDYLGDIGEPLIAPPGMICTQTFIVVGSFHNPAQAENLFKYVKSKFSRALLGILKTTQHNSRNTWKHVPWQSFSKNSDIDWSRSVKEIDQQLYKKYKLSKKEIKFIEENVREMK